MYVTMQGQGKSSQWRLLPATVHPHAMNNFTDSDQVILHVTSAFNLEAT